MVEKKCGIFTFENITIGVLIIVLLALIFKFIQMRSNPSTESYKVNVNENVSSGKETFTGGDSKCILYYADWCPHCKAISPVFRKMKSENNGVLDLGNGTTVIIDLFEEKDIPTEDKESIEGFPTIKLKTGGTVKEYMGPRTEDAITSWLKSNA